MNVNESGAYELRNSMIVTTDAQGNVVCTTRTMPSAN